MNIKFYSFKLLRLVQFLRMPEFRSVMYYRCKTNSINPIKLLYPPLSSLYILEDQVIGHGLMIQHGFSTIINAREIGKYCQIWQGVTIGKSKSGLDTPRPKIGNNVKICCNSIIIGDIEIGDNCIIGAGAVVRENMPSNTTAIGNPAIIYQKKEK